MVQWLADADVRGYTSGPLPDTDAYHLIYTSATPIDLNAVTRLHRTGGNLSRPDVYGGDNRIAVTGISLRFSAGDIPTPPTSRFRNPQVHATLAIAKASQFAEGATPTASQIFASAQWRIDSRQFRSSAGDLLADIAGPGPDDPAFTANTKYWLAVIPTYSMEQFISPIVGPGFWVRMGAGPIGTPSQVSANSRVISLWSNRTPNAPEITSPAPGAPVNPGTLVTLTIDPDDPDRTSLTYDTAGEDIAGVQVQYAAPPTPENPTQTWLDLPFADKAGWVGAPGLRGWYITQSPESDSTRDGVHTLWSTGSVQIQCGGSTPTAGAGMLPPGTWQVRVRTFDYGHPFPNNPYVAPLGRLPGASITPGNYAVENISPWSEPVTISSLEQVPAPVPIRPTGGTAIPDDKPTTLVWQYRNTASFPQKSRVIEMRKVGDAAWTEVSSADSADPTFLVPSVPVPGFTFHDDGTSTTGWTLDPGSYETVSGPAAGDFWGLPSIEFTATEAADDNFVYVGASRAVAGVPASGVKTVTLVGFRYNGDNAFLNPVVATLKSSGVPIPATLVSHSGDTRDGNPGVRVMKAWELVFEVPDGESFDEIEFQFWASADSGTTPPLSPAAPFMFWVNDITVQADGTPAFPLVATTEYEWRVKVTDTDDVSSGFSEASRFWIVPAPGSGTVAPNPATGEAAGTLGVGTHRVEVYRRGGTERVGELTQISSVEWNRVRDDIGDAKIVVSGWDEDCGALLARLQTWAYEIVITRDTGYSQDRVWEGPITLLTYRDNEVVISAKDVMVYLYRRIIKQTMSDVKNGALVTSRAAQIIQNVLAPDDPNVLAYMRVISDETVPMQYRHTPPYSRTAFEEVDDMASNAGLDYTAVGRAILLWGTKTAIGVLPEFRDKDLGESPIVSEYGMQMANVYSVSDGNGLFGFTVAPGSGLTKEGNTVSGNDASYGLVELLSSSWASDSEEDSGTYTAEGRAKVIASFEKFSERSIANRYPPPVIVRVPDNTSVNPDAPISIQNLVPGVAIPLRSVSTLREVSALQKLDSVKVVEEAGRETISITLSPFSGDDAAVEDGGEE